VTGLLSLVVARAVRIVSERRLDLAVQANAKQNACIVSGEATALLYLRTEPGRALLRFELADADFPVTSARSAALRCVGIEFCAFEPSFLLGDSRSRVHSPDPDRIGFGDNCVVGRGLEIVVNQQQELRLALSRAKTTTCNPARVWAYRS
jgi:hypothetical protein